MKPRPSLRRRVTLSALVVLLLFGAAELVCRPLFPVTEGWYEESRLLIQNWGLSGLAEILEPDAERFWTLKKNLRAAKVAGTLHDYALDFRVRTSAEGLRGHEPRPEARLRILALGDSCTFGLGVEDAESYPAQLQQLFDNETLPRAVDVRNGGIPGYTAFQGRRALEQWLPRFQPHLVTVCFGFNDADRWDNRSDAEHFRDLQIQRVDGVLARSALYRALRSLTARVSRSAREMPPPSTGELHESQAAVPPRPRLSKEEFRAELHAIGALCRAQRIPVIFLIWPYAGQILQKERRHIQHQGEILRLTDEEKYTLVNIFALFSEQAGSGADLFVDHVHASVRGNQWIAETLFGVVKGMLGL